MGERLAARAPGRGRRGHRRCPTRPRPAAIGYAAGSGHPVPRGPGQEPLHRADVHPARPGAARARRPAQVQPAARGARGQAGGGGRRLHRARHDHPQARGDAARGRRRARCTCASRSPPIISPCFYGIDMADQDRADRRRPRRARRSATRSAPTSLAYLSLDGLQAATGEPADRFCRACLTGEYPTAIPDACGREAALRAAGRRGGRRVSDREPLPTPTRASASTPAEGVSSGSEPRSRRPAPARCWATSAGSPACSPPSLADPLLAAGCRRRRNQGAAGRGGRAARRTRRRPGGHVRQRRHHAAARAPPSSSTSSPAARSCPSGSRRWWRASPTAAGRPVRAAGRRDGGAPRHDGVPATSTWPGSASACASGGR